MIMEAISLGIATGKEYSKGYKAIRVINSKKKNSKVSSCSSPFYSLHLIFNVFFLDIFWDKYHFLCFHFFEFSCWLSSTNNLIWIFVTFVAFI